MLEFILLSIFFDAGLSGCAQATSMDNWNTTTNFINDWALLILILLFVFCIPEALWKVFIH
jgi:hypothetical protein